MASYVTDDIGELARQNTCSAAYGRAEHCVHDGLWSTVYMMACVERLVTLMANVLQGRSAADGSVYTLCKYVWRLHEMMQTLPLIVRLRAIG